MVRRSSHSFFWFHSYSAPPECSGLAGSAAAAVNALLEKIKARHSIKPPLVLQTDNGPEFKVQFEQALDKDVKVTHGPAYSSNSQGEVENANKIWRGVIRRRRSCLFLSRPPGALSQVATWSAGRTIAVSLVPPGGA